MTQTTPKTTTKTQVWVIYGICVLVFLLHRYLVRPWVLSGESEGLLLIIVNSTPNFIEGIVGPMFLAGLVLSYRVISRPQDPNIESKQFYMNITLIAAVYVVLQETNWMNVTRPNVYDPFDLIASFLGLALINRLLVGGGMLNRDITDESQESATS